MRETCQSCGNLDEVYNFFLNGLPYGYYCGACFGRRFYDELILASKIWMRRELDTIYVTTGEEVIDDEEEREDDEPLLETDN